MLTPAVVVVVAVSAVPREGQMPSKEGCNLTRLEDGQKNEILLSQPEYVQTKFGSRKLRVSCAKRLPECERAGSRAAAEWRRHPLRRQSSSRTLGKRRTQTLSRRESQNHERMNPFRRSVKPATTLSTLLASHPPLHNLPTPFFPAAHCRPSLLAPAHSSTLFRYRVSFDVGTSS